MATPVELCEPMQLKTLPRCRGLTLKNAKVYWLPRDEVEKHYPVLGD